MREEAGPWQRMSTLQWVGLRSTGCGYCNRRRKGNPHNVGMIADELSVYAYQDLLDHGWRRSGTFLYRPITDGACCPAYTIRLDTLNFSPSAKHRRVQRRFEDFLSGRWAQKQQEPQQHTRPAGEEGQQNTQQRSARGRSSAAPSEGRRTHGSSCDRDCERERRSEPLAGDAAPLLSSERGAEIVLLIAQHLSSLLQHTLDANTALQSLLGDVNVKFTVSMKTTTGSNADRMAPAEPGSTGAGTSSGVTLSCAVCWQAASRVAEQAAAAAPQARADSAPSTPGIQQSKSAAKKARKREAKAGQGPKAGVAAQAQSLAAQVVERAGHPDSPWLDDPIVRLLMPDNGAGSPLCESRGHLQVPIQPARWPQVCTAAAALLQRARPAESTVAAGATADAQPAESAAADASARGHEDVDAFAATPGKRDRSTLVTDVDEALACDARDASDGCCSGDGGSGTEEEGTDWEGSFEGESVEDDAHRDSALGSQHPSANGANGASAGGGDGANGSNPQPWWLQVPAEDAGWAFRLELRPSVFDEREFKLWQKYQRAVHRESTCTQRSYKNFLVHHPFVPVSRSEDPDAPESGYGAFHLQFWVGEHLIAVSYVDILPRCVSSKYFTWDPDLKFLSLGVFSALKEIEWARTAHAGDSPLLRYSYLGFYIHSNQKMRYKAQFQVSDLLCPRTLKWVPYTTELQRALDEQDGVDDLSELGDASEQLQCVLARAGEAAGRGVRDASDVIVRLTGFTGAVHELRRLMKPEHYRIILDEVEMFLKHVGIVVAGRSTLCFG